MHLAAVSSVAVRRQAPTVQLDSTPERADPTTAARTPRIVALHDHVIEGRVAVEEEEPGAPARGVATHDALLEPWRSAPEEPATAGTRRRRAPGGARLQHAAAERR